ncbi:MAG: glycosyltransferase family 4 protein [Oscillatoriales cyanobacterium SM2_1_8]|nr:glycosyltransferase family 4 protein [Oscillatoriales cyanobacterium SM2_1_8]
MGLLLASTPVGPMGTGIGGGVELTLRNLVQELQRRGETVDVLAPAGSMLPAANVIAVPGDAHPFAQNDPWDAPIQLPTDSVLARMWDWVRRHQHGYDLVVNFAYDWLPFYLTPFLQIPVLHFVSMGSLQASLDRMLAQTAVRFPGTLGVYTRIQAQSFAFTQHQPQSFRVLGSGIDLSLYEYRADAGPQLAWVGRIAPEKGLEDAAAVSARLDREVWVMGKMQDEAYWQRIQQDFPTAQLIYTGFHDTTNLQSRLGQCQALLMTPKWVEAFGNVAIEALACGVPVISYARGPHRNCRHQETGFLVEPDNLDSLCQAVAQVPALRRDRCRRQAEREYSLEALGDRFQDWFATVRRT